MPLGSKFCVTSKFWKECKQMGKTTALYHRKTTKKISKIIQPSAWLTLQKNELGKISKVILDRINRDIQENLQPNQ